MLTNTVKALASTTCTYITLLHVHIYIHKHYYMYNPILAAVTFKSAAISKSLWFLI